MAGFILRGLDRVARPLGRHRDARRPHPSTTPATLVLAGLLLGVVNAIVRPFALLLSLPALLFTLGLFLLVVNAAMLGLVALMLPGFHIDGFWTAVGGSLIVSVVSWVGSWFIGPKGRVEVIRHKSD